MITFDQLHVISDLHLGGPKDRQVFNQGAALAGVIRYLARASPEQRVGLVVNGDFVDFLATENAAYLDTVHALAKLKIVRGDPAFRDVFDALETFVKSARRTLIVVIGNHDLELALPDVRLWFEDQLSGGDDAARGRIVWAMDGSGFSCDVGGERVLCIHGNERDEFNVVDHEALRDVVSALNADAAHPPWQPNPGTRLVIDVINGIKKRYPFVDLLKPENKAVPWVLLALPTDYKTSIMAFARGLAAAKLVNKPLMQAGYLSTAGTGDKEALDALLSAAPPPHRRAEVAREGDALDRMAAYLSSDQRAADLVTSSSDEMLGGFALVLDRLFGQDPAENLRSVLEPYAGDDTFSLDGPDEVFRSLDREVGPAVRFLVAGHTHLRRSRRRANGRGVYYNSGTWIRLLHLTPEILEKASFERSYRALMSNSYDGFLAVEDLVLQLRTMVSIWTERGGTHAELREVRAAEHQAAGSPPWDAVPGSQSP